MITPFNFDISGVVQADGTASIPIKQLKAGPWSLLMASVQQTDSTGKLVGNPSWKLTVNGKPLANGQSNHADLGPRPVTPADQISVDVVGGIPGSIVSGSAHGIQTNVGGSIGVSELLHNYIPTPNLVASAVSPASPSVLIPGTAISVLTTFQKLVLAPGSNAVKLAFHNTQNPLTPLVNVTGDQSGVQYFPATQSGRGPVANPLIPTDIPIEIDWDSSVSIQVDPNGSFTPINVWCSAIPIVEAVQVFSQTALSVIETLPAAWQSPVTSTGNNDVSGRIGLSALTGGVANRVQLVPAAPGLAIRLFYFHINGETAVAGNAFHLCDGDPNTTGVIIDDFSTNPAGERQGGFYGGRVLTSGNGLFLYTDLSGTGQVHGGFIANQGRF